jgi:hypothetical protein
MLSGQLSWRDNNMIDEFVSQCYNGDLYKVVELYDNMTPYVRSHCANNGTSFQMACFGGHLHIAEWIHSQVHNYKIHTLNYNEAFYLACSGGHAHIAHWLYSFGCIDIYKEQTRAFFRAKCNRHKDVLKFFISLDTRFYQLCRDLFD